MITMSVTSSLLSYEEYFLIYSYQLHKLKIIDKFLMVTPIPYHNLGYSLLLADGLKNIQSIFC